MWAHFSSAVSKIQPIFFQFASTVASVVNNERPLQVYHTKSVHITYWLFRRQLKGHLFREAWTRRSVTSDMRRHRKTLTCLLTYLPLQYCERNAGSFLRMRIAKIWNAEISRYITRSLVCLVLSIESLEATEAIVFICKKKLCDRRGTARRAMSV